MRAWFPLPRRSRAPLIALLALLLLVLAGMLWLRAPGLDVRDGRNDRGKNGIALGASWISGEPAPSALAVAELARAIREHRLTEVYLQLPPPNAEGTLTGIDAMRIETLLYECYDTRAWAQIDLAGYALEDARWRRFFVIEIRRLLDRVPRLRGVQLDFSKIADVSPAMLNLLTELRPALATDTRPLSVVLGPWEVQYAQEVARRADEVIAPLEVSASAFSRFNAARNLERIRDTFAAHEKKPLRFRVPAGPRLPRALGILHLAGSRQSFPAEYQGLVLDAGAAPDDADWTVLRERFLRP